MQSHTLNKITEKKTNFMVWSLCEEWRHSISNLLTWLKVIHLRKNMIDSKNNPNVVLLLSTEINTM